VAAALLALASGAHARRPGGAESLPAADRGLHLAYCPSSPHSYRPVKRMASAALANHAGWPADECLKMDKGGAGAWHTLIGVAGVHNWLLGGYGNDRVFAGDSGDVIWGDYHPSGQPESEQDFLHGGAGPDWIYASHGYNDIWTGAGNDHLALVYGHGVVHCNGKGVKTFVMRYLPQNRPWQLLGCSHKVLVRYRA
jgi:hypothetical protein